MTQCGMKQGTSQEKKNAMITGGIGPNILGYLHPLTVCGS